MGHNEEFRFGTPKKPTPHFQKWYRFLEKKKVSIVGNICSLEMNFELRVFKGLLLSISKKPSETRGCWGHGEPKLIKSLFGD